MPSGLKINMSNINDLWTLIFGGLAKKCQFLKLHDNFWQYATK